MVVQIKISTLISIYLVQDWFFYVISSHNASKSTALVFLEVYRSTLIKHSYLASPPVQLEVYKTWSLVCLCKHSLSPSAVTKRFCLDTLECSHSWCLYTVHSTLSWCDAGHQVCVFFLWYTGCNRRNVRDFRRVLLMLNYTDITQNTYIQSWTVTEIMAWEV